MKKFLIVIVILFILTTMSVATKLIIDEKNIKEALKKIYKKYGKKITSDIEKIFRLETAHFKSLQFLRTGSPGMEKHAEKYPYGWTSIKPLWDANPKYKPIGFYSMNENKTGKEKTFLEFPSIEASMFSLAAYLEKYPPARWYSTDKIAQAEYQKKLDAIKTPYTNELTT